MAVETTNQRIETLLSAARAIYIIDSAGLLLHHEFFLGQDEDPDLYSGLFSAVNVYAKELKAGAIKTIKLENYKFVFSEHTETGYLIVLDVSTELSDTDGVWLLEQIIRRFDAMQNLFSKDFMGSLKLETLFDERGKEINWDTIHAIREGAVETQKHRFDKVETLNLTRINIHNRTWVKIRKIITTLVENHTGLLGSFVEIIKNEHTNILYCGRDRDKLVELEKYLENKLQKQVGLELETELINIEEQYIAIYPMLVEDGAVMAISSEDKYLVARLNNQLERMVASIEKITSS